MAARRPYSVLPPSFGTTTTYECYDCYVNKGDQGLGIKLKNIEEKAVVRGFAPWRFSAQPSNTSKTTTNSVSGEADAAIASSDQHRGGSPSAALGNVGDPANKRSEDESCDGVDDGSRRKHGAATESTGSESVTRIESGGTETGPGHSGGEGESVVIGRVTLRVKVRLKKLSVH